jgi:hypothetical protein
VPFATQSDDPRQSTWRACGARDIRLARPAWRSGVLLLVFVPLTVDGVFRAIAPGVNNTSGHADGIRTFVTFAVLSALTAVGLIYHLHFANQRREPPQAASDG